MTGHRFTSAIAVPLLALVIAITPARADGHLQNSADFIRSLADRAITTLTAESQMIG